MNADLNTVLDAAMKLSANQQRELIDRLKVGDDRKRRKDGDIRKFFGMIDSGDPDSANNEKIDSDLAEAYADNHEFEN